MNNKEFLKEYLNGYSPVAQETEGQKYVDKFKKLTYNLIPQHIVYSKIDGTKTEHGINIK